jgi:hypothetical protein
MTQRNGRDGPWTVGEHLLQGYSITAYCNNLRCGRSKRRHGRALDLAALDPALTLDEVRARLKCVDCGQHDAILIRLPPEGAAERPNPPLQKKPEPISGAGVVWSDPKLREIEK